MGNKIISALRLTFNMSRLPVAAILLLFAAMGAARTGSVLQPEWNLLPLAAMVVAILVNAAALNDLADEQIDKVNLPDSPARPLASGLATRRQIWILAVLAASAALALGGFGGLRLMTVGVFGVVFNVAYSLRPLRLSRQSLLAPLVLPLAYVITPFMIGLTGTGGGLNRRDLILMAGLYACFVGRIILKDFRDVKGDALFGKITFLLRYGRAATCATSALFWTVGAALLASVNGVFALIMVIYLPLIYVGLYLLYKARDYQAEQIIIWSTARVGTAIALGLFAAIQVANEPFLRQTLIIFGAGLPFVGIYASTLKSVVKLERPTFRIFVAASKTHVTPLQGPYW